ncbi:hypothetical protein T05_8914 [Trichinella murrelli]|uniref:Uncharacterized protein n=1 Tax=Trichinella murrelli TaxID=144512 RepID=A0A0V0TXE5_9BILA|nr:hypothetical protein T05_8914 [Trichinella murrelli]
MKYEACSKFYCASPNPDFTLQYSRDESTALQHHAKICKVQNSSSSSSSNINNNNVTVSKY